MAPSGCPLKAIASMWPSRHSCRLRVPVSLCVWVFVFLEGKHSMPSLPCWVYSDLGEEYLRLDVVFTLCLYNLLY